MRKLVGLCGMTVGGTIGWWAGDYVGFMTAFFASVVGTALGGYYAVRWLAHHVDNV